MPTIFFTLAAFLKKQPRKQLERYRRRTGRRERTQPRPLPVIGDLGGLAVLRGQRERERGAA
ncbi:MAG: hypothetical protein LBK60_07205 [Verrucomicrobiales bacterium]|jgi:hypothetical protein|nr:hypothetical protein [Verrucomicrobiales bacterium]